MKKQDLLDNAETAGFSKAQCSLLEGAIDLATTKHDGQMRKSGEPYIIHPLSVANILLDWGMDLDSIIAGVLHDTVEDTDQTLADLESKFGKDAAFLVDGVTKVSKARSGMQDIASYLPATKDNLSKLLIAVGQDVRVIIIKLADRLHNLSTLEHMPPEKQVKIARESLEVFAPMADRLGMGRVRTQIEELSFRYLDPKEYRRLERLMKQRLGKSHRKLEHVRHEVTEALKQADIKATIDGRVKSTYSVYKKLKKTDESIDDIYDLIALRIIVSSKADCYQVLGLLHSLYQPMVTRIKDYIASPKPNGYQSLHTTVITPQKQIVEFQIRTRSMHEYAEQGLAASFHYNEQKLQKSYKKGQSATLPEQLKWIVELQETSRKLLGDEAVELDKLKIDLFANRIFVYSPKGDIYNLPEGAFPLDYAYLVHSDIGNHAGGFKVNGKMIPFDKNLQNGDVVEVLTKRLTVPRVEWLEMVKTVHARNKLRAQLKKYAPLTGLRNATKR